MFGAKPQNKVGEKWIFGETKLIDQQGGAKSVHVTMIINLRNEGPGLARELYLNLSAFPSTGATNVNVGHIGGANFLYETVALKAGMVVSSAVAKDSYKLAPDFITPVFSIMLRLMPPIETALFLKLAYGAEVTHTKVREIQHTPSQLERLYDSALRDGPQSMISALLDLDSLAK
jgi:hypothetical protein